MSDLANRLVTAAVKAQQDGLGVEEKARLSVSAVLRELAKSADSFSEDLRLHAHQRRDLEALAGVIEKGEQA